MESIERLQYFGETPKYCEIEIHLIDRGDVPEGAPELPARADRTAERIPFIPVPRVGFAGLAFRGAGSKGA
jgi:hypothetical protein